MPTFARRLTRAAAAFAALALLAAAPARAGWSPDPVEVYPTTNTCPLVTAAGDGVHGTIVVWQELTLETAGVLRARHLLANGDVDPAWPALASVSGQVAPRNALGSVADGLGGAYIWWLADAQLSLTRLGPDGAVAPGWPPNGRMLGYECNAAQRPGVIADGAHGVYVAWNPTTGFPGTNCLMLDHRSPGNTGAGGFPVSGQRVIGANPEATELVGASAIGLAPDGGAWVAWGASIVGDTTIEAGEYRVVRLTSAGLPAPGWPARGVAIGTFPGDKLATARDWSATPAMSLVSVASDGGDGAFVIRGDADTPWGPGFVAIVPVVLHVDGSGAPANGWPATGLVVQSIGAGAAGDHGATASLRAFGDGAGGVVTVVPGFFTEGLSELLLLWYGPAAVKLPGSLRGPIEGTKFAALPDGSIALTSSKATGHYGMYESDAFVHVELLKGGGWGESHEPAGAWYGDADAALLGDGSAVLAWSEVQARHGIYAARVNAGGLVTGVVPAGVVAPRLSLQYAPGTGVTLFTSLAAGGPARCLLADVAGRVAASGTFSAAAGHSRWTLPGTAALAPGVYLARVECAGRRLTAKVAVVR